MDKEKKENTRLEDLGVIFVSGTIDDSSSENNM